jgi:hypothetical protein
MTNRPPIPTKKTVIETPVVVDEDPAALKKRIAELEKQVEKMAVMDRGWLITTRNPVYDGVTASVKFENGMAFIVEGQRYPRFETEKMKATQLEKYSVEERAEMKKREAVASSQRAMEEMKEFGYEVEWIQDLETLEARKRARIAQAERRRQEMDEANKMAKMAGR